MKTKTRDLIGIDLDWAVAKCEGRELIMHTNRMGTLSFDAGLHPYMADPDNPGRWQVFAPSIKWSQGGPIIEREGIILGRFFLPDVADAMAAQAVGWVARVHKHESLTEPALRGRTPLIAAMRALVASRLGDEVDVPDALR